MIGADQDMMTEESDIVKIAVEKRGGHMERAERARANGTAGSPGKMRGATAMTEATARDIEGKDRVDTVPDPILPPALPGIREGAEEIGADGMTDEPKMSTLRFIVRLA